MFRKARELLDGDGVLWLLWNFVVLIGWGGALAGFLAFPLSRPPDGFAAFFTGP